MISKLKIKTPIGATMGKHHVSPSGYDGKRPISPLADVPAKSGFLELVSTSPKLGSKPRLERTNSVMSNNSDAPIAGLLLINRDLPLRTAVTFESIFPNGSVKENSIVAPTTVDPDGIDVLVAVDYLKELIRRLEAEVNEHDDAYWEAEGACSCESGAPGDGIRADEALRKKKEAEEELKRVNAELDRLQEPAAAILASLGLVYSPGMMTKKVEREIGGKTREVPEIVAMQLGTMEGETLRKFLKVCSQTYPVKNIDEFDLYY